MFFCKNCGNDIKSLYTQIHKQQRRYGITGCPRWLYYIKYIEIFLRVLMKDQKNM